RIDKSQSEQRRRAAAREHIRGAGNGLRLVLVILLSIETDGVVLQQRATQRGQGVERPVVLQTPEARLQALVGSADRSFRTRVAGDARGLVEDGSEALLHRFDLGEIVLAVLERRHLLGGEPGKWIAKVGESPGRQQHGSEATG